MSVALRTWNSAAMVASSAGRPFARGIHLAVLNRKTTSRHFTRWPGDAMTILGDFEDAIVRGVKALADVVEGPLKDFAQSDVGKTVFRAMATWLTGGLAPILGPQLASARLRCRGSHAGSVSMKRGGLSSAGASRRPRKFSDRRSGSRSRVSLRRRGSSSSDALKRRSGTLRWRFQLRPIWQPQ
jgi:hypothetical protein